MSFISILLPSFYCPTNEKKDAELFFADKMGVNKDDFELFYINPAETDKIEYAVRLKKSKLSLNYLETILYQKSSMKIYLDKAFESLQGMMSRISVLENELRENNFEGREK